MRMTHPARGAGVALAAVFLGMLVLAQGFPAEAALFPRIVAVAGLMLAGLLVAAPERHEAEIFHSGEAGERHPVLSLAAAPCFAVAVWLLGFYPASFLALLILPWLLGFRRPVLLLAIAVAAVVVIGLVFNVAMEIALPDGVVGDFVLRRFVYSD